MRAFRTVGLIAAVLVALGVGYVRAAASEVGLKEAIRGEVTDIHIAGCDWGTCEGALTLWHDGSIQTVMVTPATRITSGGQVMPLEKLRPGESVAVIGYDTAPVPGPEDWTVRHR